MPGTQGASPESPWGARSLAALRGSLLSTGSGAGTKAPTHGFPFLHGTASPKHGGSVVSARGSLN